LGDVSTAPPTSRFWPLHLGGFPLKTTNLKCMYKSPII
jgi:hypothetical protein